MESSLFLDLARAVHLIGLAVGLGLAICADMLAAKAVFRPLGDREIWVLDVMHKVVFAGLALLWASGLALLHVRTGWDIAQFTPKLITKLVVVVLLTFNAFLIGTIALPQLRLIRGRLFGVIDLRTRLTLSIIAGLSASCWFSALALGVIGQLKPQPFDTLVPLFGSVFGVSLLAAILIGYFADLLPRAQLTRSTSLYGVFPAE